jgi:hypothetical protein
MRRTDKSQRLELILKVFHRFFQDMQRPGAYINGGDVAMFRRAIVAFAVVACSCRDGQTIRSSTFSPSPTRPVSPHLEVAAGGTLTATIWGDSTPVGEDDTGSNCDEHDSRGVHANGCLLITVHTPGPGRLTARLRWDGGPGTEMGVFISTGFYAGQGAHGVSPLEVAADVRGDTLIVVSLERAAGVRPVPPSASQVFELATQWVAR